MSVNYIHEETAFYHSTTLKWEEISHAMRKLIHVWSDGSEMEWAGQCWEMIAAAGQAEYDDELSRTKVIIRAVSLGMIYRDFCELACDEPYERDEYLSDALDSLEISQFHLGQLFEYSQQSRVCEKVPGNSDCVISALLDFADAERSSLCAILTKGSGGFKGVCRALFLSKSRSASDEKDTEEWDFMDEEFRDAAETLKWVQDGMPPL